MAISEEERQRRLAEMMDNASQKDERSLALIAEAEARERLEKSQVTEAEGMVREGATPKFLLKANADAFMGDDARGLSDRIRQSRDQRRGQRMEQD